MIDFYNNPGTRVDLSDEARAFLRDWLEWVKRGAPTDEPYRRYTGLCSNSYTYDNDGDISDELDSVFSSSYPFSKQEYFTAKYFHTMHEDERRLAFVRANI